MKITEILDKLLGNEKASVDIAEALGGSQGQTVTEVLNKYESITLVPKSEPIIYTVTYNVNGGEGSIESVEVTAGESITLNDGSGLTAPTGKIFAGWAKSASAQSATVTSPFIPDKNTELFAVWVDE